MATQVCSHPVQVLEWELLLLSKLWLGCWLGFLGAKAIQGESHTVPRKGTFLLDLPPGA